MSKCEQHDGEDRFNTKTVLETEHLVLANHGSDTCVGDFIVHFHRIEQPVVKHWAVVTFVQKCEEGQIKFICQGYGTYLKGRNPHLVFVSCENKTQQCRCFRQQPCEFWLVHKTLRSAFVQHDDGWMCFPALWMLLEPTAAVIFSHKHGTSVSLATFDRDSYNVMDHSFSWTGCALTQNDASVKSKLVSVGDLQLKCGIRQKSNTYADKTSIRRGEECPMANLTNLICLCSQRNVLAMGQSVLYLGCANANKKKMILIPTARCLHTLSS